MPTPQFSLPLAVAFLLSATLAAAPAPHYALTLFVGFETGGCEPRGADHSAALYAASSPLGGKAGCAGAWKRSAPSLSLATSQLAGNVALLGTDTASGSAWGTWLMGAIGGGPPYTQMLTAVSFNARAGGPPVIAWTCHPPSTAIGVPGFDRRVDSHYPLFFTNGSFVVLGNPAVAGTGEWDATASASPGDADGMQSFEMLKGSSAGAFIAREEREEDGRAPQQTLHPSAPSATRALRAADIPDCAVKKLGAFALPGPGVQQAVVFDTTFLQPCAVTLTLELAAGSGYVVTAQRVSVSTGNPINAPVRLVCAACDSYLYQPISVTHGTVFLSTINYTTNIITSFSGKLTGGGSGVLSPVSGSAAFVLRESDVIALPSTGITAPYPLGLAALQFTTPHDSWACHNASTLRNVRTGSVAAAGSKLKVQHTCTLPLCAQPSESTGGCLLPQFGFL